jgi:excisionase family DNA binding protein
LSAWKGQTGRPKGARNGKPKPQPAETADLVARRQLWPVAEAAYQLGMHRVTLHKKMTAGEIRFVKVGRRTFVTDAELRRYVSNLVAAADA